MGSFGRALVEARRGRGLSLDDVARETRLAKRYLLSLENETLNELPGGTYNRAYLKTYASVLALDPKVLLQDYENEVLRQAAAGRLPGEPDAVAAMRELAKRKSSPSGPVKSIVGTAGFAGAALLALAVIGGAGWFALRGSGASDSHQIVHVEPGAASTSVSIGETPTAAANGKPAALRAPVPIELPRPAPSPAPQEPPAVVISQRPKPVRMDTNMAIADSGVGTGVVGRRLVGRSDTFAVGTPVVFWTFVTAGLAGDAIRHVWIHENRTSSVTQLPIGGPSWRTQSRRTLPAEGQWVVEARSADGRVLARHQFRGTR